MANDSFQECLETNVSDPIEYSRQLSKEIKRVENIANQGGNGIGKDGTTNTPEADIPWGNKKITDLAGVDLDDGVASVSVSPFKGPYNRDGFLFGFTGSNDFSLTPAFGSSILLQNNVPGATTFFDFVSKDDDGTDSVGFSVARRSGAQSVGAIPLEFGNFAWRAGIGRYSLDETGLFGGTFYPFQLTARADTSTPNILMQTNGSTDFPAGNVRIAGNLGVGNSAAATSLGTVTKKIEIFDAAGASLGFIPVYDSIT